MSNDIIQFPTMVNPQAINSIDQLRAELERAQEEKLGYFLQMTSLDDALQGYRIILHDLCIARVSGTQEDVNAKLDRIIEKMTKKSGGKK